MSRTSPQLEPGDLCLARIDQTQLWVIVVKECRCEAPEAWCGSYVCFDSSGMLEAWSEDALKLRA